MTLGPAAAKVPPIQFIAGVSGHSGEIPQVQFLDKVDDTRCCAMTFAWGFTEQKTVEVPQLQCSDKVDDVPVVQVVVRVSWKVPQIQFIA